MRILFILFSLFFFVTGLQAQSNEWLYFGNGNNVNALAETSTSLWVGTAGGLVHYDKSTGKGTVYDKTNSSLRSNYIKALTLDSDGGVWISTQNELVHKTGSGWTTYNFDTVFTPINLGCLLIDRIGSVWVGVGHDGLLSIDTAGVLAYYQVSGTVHTLDEDSAGNIWIGFSGAQNTPAVARFDGSQFTYYSASDLGLSDVGFFVYNYGLAIDGTGNKWVIHNSGELIKWTDTTKVKTQTNIYQPRALLKDNDGFIWMFDADSNLLKIKDTIVDMIKLPTNTAHVLAMNTSGKLWLGTYTGIYEQVSGNWVRRQLPYENRPSGYIYDVEVSGNEVWANHFSGKIYTDSVHWQTLDNDIYPEVRSVLHAPGGITWFGTGNGLYKYDGQNLTHYNSVNSGLPYDVVISLVLNTSGALWAGTTYGGLARFDGTNWLTFNESNSDMPDNQVNALAVTNDNVLWIGTPVGIIAYDGVNWEKQSLSISWVSDIAVDGQNRVWIASSAGVLKYESGSWLPVTLPINGNVYALAAEGNTDLWIGIHGYGLYHFDGSSWEEFTPNNSPMPSEYINSIKVDAEGNKWIATQRGLIVYRKNGIVVGLNGEEPSESIGSWLYPNPVQDDLSVKLPANAEAYSISIYNTAGQLIYKIDKVKEPSLRINLHNLGSGLYILKVRSREGQEVLSSRLIKM